MAAVNPFDALLHPLSMAETHDGLAHAAPLPLLAIKGMREQGTAAPRCFDHTLAQGRIIALQGPASSANLQPKQSISLLYISAGQIWLRQHEASASCTAGDCLIVPAQPTHWRSTSFSVVCVMLSLAELSKTCSQLGSESGMGHCHDRLTSSLGCRQRDHGPCEASLLKALERNLQSLADCLDADRNLIAQLGLEEQLYRLVALLLLGGPTTLTGSDADRLAADSASNDFDALLDYIDSHLEQPLNLTLLQSQIHYSRRAVQYAFRRRLGCTATQWIRARRLDRAHSLLRQAASDDTVARIAQACGYRSMSLFSIEFQQRFHIKPSILLRHARIEPNPPDGESREPC